MKGGRYVVAMAGPDVDMPLPPGASEDTLFGRALYGGRKARSAVRRLRRAGWFVVWSRA